MESFECKNQNLVLLNQSNGTSRLLLNDPHKNNALSKEMIDCLINTLNKIAADDRQKLVIIRGAGGSFCSGADLNWMKKAISQSDEKNKNDAALFFELYTLLFHFPKPIIMWVEKCAMGGALGLLACADYVIADTHVKMAFSEVKLGLVPATISPFVLQKIGLSHAKAFMLSGAIFSAKQARRMGLIHEVLPAMAIPDRIKELTDQFKQNSAEAMMATKRLLNKLIATPLNEVKDMCCDHIATSRRSEEGQEGVSAFLEKRKPNWNK